MSSSRVSWAIQRTSTITPASKPKMTGWATCCLFLLLAAQQSESVPQRPQQVLGPRPQQVLGLAVQLHYLLPSDLPEARLLPEHFPVPVRCLFPVQFFRRICRGWIRLQLLEHQLGRRIWQSDRNQLEEMINNVLLFFF